MSASRCSFVERAVLVAVCAVAASAQGCFRECEHFNDCPVGHVCSADGACTDQCPDDGTGPLKGRIVTPDGDTPVIGATVVLSGEVARETVSGPDGSYSFDDVPAGETFVTAGKGKFYGTERVEVCGGEQNALNVAIKPPPHSMAVVPGDYDTIEAVLNLMGLGLDEHFAMVPKEQLRDPSSLEGIEYLFLNCTNETLADDALVQNNIRDFVEGGGRLYASDWAFEYVEALWPEAIDFPADPRIGVEGGFTADVIDPELGAYLGKTTVALQYDLGAWVVSTGLASGEVVVQGTYPFIGASGGREFQEGPLLMQFNAGAGRVTYTTFHNEAQATDDMDRILVYLVFNL